MTISADDPRIADIMKAGRFRHALFLPQYADGPDGGLIPIGAGLIARELLSDLAARLGIDFEIIRQPTPHGAIDAVNAGAFDSIILGVNPERRGQLDFTPTVFRFDFAYMVPPGSSITQASQVDRAGVRISVPVGHASWVELRNITRAAEIIGGELPDEAFAMVRDGGADVFALPREQLLDYADRLPGARILDDGFGFNDVGIAVAKGRSGLCGFISDFTEEAKASGRVKQILDEAELTQRGFSVA